MTAQDSCANVSVVIPTYFSAQTLTRSLQSIEAQTVQILEVVVVDDSGNSAEASKIVEIIQNMNLLKDKIIFYQNEKNMGPSYSRNKGIALSKGRYVAFLDSDDVWHPIKIETQYILMESKGIDLSGHRFQHILKQEWESLSKVTKMRNIHRLELMIHNPFATPTVMVRRENFIHFPEDLRLGEDYWCWISNFRSGKMLFVDQILAGGFKHSYGISGLSENIKAMSNGVIQVFMSLHRNGYINAYECCLAIFIEKIKYIGRYLSIKSRRLKTLVGKFQRK